MALKIEVTLVNRNWFPFGIRQLLPNSYYRSAVSTGEEPLSKAICDSFTRVRFSGKRNRREEGAKAETMDQGEELTRGRII